jgi:ribonuclease Z
MGVGFARMDKIFLNHLHGDHMSDLTHIYCFGPSGDRKSPLYVFGPGPSGVRSPRPPYPVYDDGTNALCGHLREALRWHSESFSFQPTSYRGYRRPTQQSWGLPVHPTPVSDDPWDDAYAMVPIELNWRKVGGVAYNNPTTGVKITHFPVIHCRKGSLGYKLEWNGLSMIYTSDTKPETNTILQASNGGQGVDVLIHEMVVPPEVWAMENSHFSQLGSGPLWKQAVDQLTAVQDSSHTPQGAFGHLLSQINPRPRLTVATHFPVSDDTIACALESIHQHCGDIGTDISKLGEYGLTWSFDLMVIRVKAGNGISKPDIQQFRATVLDYGFSPIVQPAPGRTNPPKYHNPDGSMDAYAQIDLSTAVLAGDDTYCKDGY